MHSTYIGRISLLAAILFAFVCCLPHSSEASPEKLIVKIVVNTEVKGDYIVHIDTDEDFLIKPDDLAGMGINAPAGRTAVIDGEAYQSLRSIKGIGYTFDKKTLTLNITSAPSLLPKAVIDLSPPSKLTVQYPRESSAFLNYGLSYNRNDITDSHSFTLSNKLGVHSGDFLFLNDSIYTQTPQESKFVRLMSTLTYERRSDLQWFIAGDTFASSGELGSTINIGGLGLAKMYRIDPYFIRQPMFNISGVTSLPSVASVYLDGLLVKKENLTPGAFDLNNLHYYGGSHLVEIVVKDAFGNEQRIVRPFYFTDDLLKKGLHEYGYYAGFLREQYGVESNEYGDPAFSAFHRYALSDALTLGGRAEATRGLFNIGPQASFRLWNAGVVLLTIAGSRGDSDSTGHAESFSHSYQHGRFATRFLYKQYSQNYTTIQNRFLTARPKSEAGAGVSYSLSSGSAVSADYLSVRDYSGTGRDSLSGTYSRTFFNNLTGYVTVRHTKDLITGDASEFLVGINMTFGKNTYGSSLNRYSDGARDNLVQVYKNIPGGEGLSYRASYESQDSDTLRSDTINPYAQYNAKYGIYSVDYGYQRTNDQAYSNYTVAASGALVYAGGFLGFTRPVNDSFSIVKVDNLKDVKVKLADMDMGTTDSSGTLVIPEIRSYNYNQVSLEAASIPMDYQFSNVNTYISPSQWSGSCVVVAAKKMQAYTGTLLAPGSDGSRHPVEMRELTMTVKGRTVRIPTGKGGEFYFENTIGMEKKEQKAAIRGCEALSGKETESPAIVAAGTYPVSFEYEGRSCSALLTIEKSDDPIVDLGETIARCEGAPAPRQGTSTPAIAAPAPTPAPAAPAVSGKKPEPPAEDLTIALNLDAKGRPAAGRDRKMLVHVLTLLKRHPELFVEISAQNPWGADRAGSRIFLKKAEAVKRYLITSGLQADRIKQAGNSGKTKEDCGPGGACNENNRRILIKIEQAPVRETAR